MRPRGGSMGGGVARSGWGRAERQDHFELMEARAATRDELEAAPAVNRPSAPPVPSENEARPGEIGIFAAPVSRRLGGL